MFGCSNIWIRLDSTRRAICKSHLVNESQRLTPAKGKLLDPSMMDMHAMHHGGSNSNLVTCFGEGYTEVYGVGLSSGRTYVFLGTDGGWFA